MTQLGTYFSTIGESYNNTTKKYQSAAFPIGVTSIPTKAVWPYV